jgi:hypothetical protein
MVSRAGGGHEAIESFVRDHRYVIVGRQRPPQRRKVKRRLQSRAHGGGRVVQRLRGALLDDAAGVGDIELHTITTVI